MCTLSPVIAAPSVSPSEIFKKDKIEEERPSYTFPSMQLRSNEEQYRKESSLCAGTFLSCRDYPEAERAREVVKRFFAAFLHGMHEGTIPEVFSEWLTEDIEWMSCKFEPNLYSIGIEKCIIGYNQALHHFLGGPNSTVIFTIHNIEMLSKDRTKITFMSDVNSSTPVLPMMKDFYARVRGNQLSEILMMPIGETLSPFKKESPVLVAPVAKFELPPPSISRPCKHNDWDSVRIKNQIVLLRCRICTSQWKIKVAQIKRCNHFPEGVCTRTKCPFLHIHVRKQTRAELEKKLADSL